MDRQNTWFVGIDTHKYQHTAVAIDGFYRPTDAVSIPNHPKYFSRLLEILAQSCSNETTLVFGL